MEKISRKLNFCGIYMLVNYVNNKKYIGSSKHIGQRLWEHRSNLRHNKHDNAHLQNAWNKYGECNFNYIILEKCSEDKQYEREQYYIDTLKPEYNICIEVAKNPPSSIESRIKQSNTRKRLMAEGIIPITNNKPVYVYYKDGSFIGKWESIRKAAEVLGVHYSSACNVFKGRYSQVKGYKFFNEEQSNMQPFEKPSRKGIQGKKKIQYTVIDSEGTTLIFNGAKSVADYFNIKETSVYQCIRKNLKIRGKYMIYKSCRSTE